jgi:hypothetical protein
VGFKEESEELLKKYCRSNTDWTFGLVPMFGTMADDLRNLCEMGHPAAATVIDSFYNEPIGAFGLRIVPVEPGRDESGGLVEQYNELLRKYPNKNVAFDVVNSLRALADHVSELRKAGQPNPESVIDELNRLIAPYGLKLIVIPVTSNG